MKDDLKDRRLAAGLISPQEASLLTGLPPQQIRLMLQSGNFAWLGSCLKQPGKNQYAYYCNLHTICEYLRISKEEAYALLGEKSILSKQKIGKW